MNCEAAARTDCGRHRAGNEDAYLLRPESGLFVVADGMGGHAAGEVASGMAIELVGTGFLDAALPDATPRAVAHALVASITRANGAILERAEREQDKKGMGTTLTALVTLERPACWVIAHVGDSRAYQFRRGKLRQLTRDHTWVETQVAQGYLTRAEARVHPFSNIVTRALGTEPTVEVDVRRGRIQEGDVLLLCSDGLTGMVTDAEMASILRAGGAPTKLAERLVDTANDHGGLDNITVLIIAIG